MRFLSIQSTQSTLSTISMPGLCSHGVESALTYDCCWSYRKSQIIQSGQPVARLGCEDGTQVEEKMCSHQTIFTLALFAT